MHKQLQIGVASLDKARVPNSMLEGSTYIQGVEYME